MAAGLLLSGSSSESSTYHSVENLKDGVAVTSTEVDDIETVSLLLVEDVLDGLQVALREIHDVDIITNTSSIRSVVIVTEDTEVLSATDGDLRDEGGAGDMPAG